VGCTRAAGSRARRGGSRGRGASDARGRAAHDAQASTVLAWIAIACSPVAVILGIVAVVLGRGRVPGVLGALVGLFANPWILLQTLTLVAP